MTTPPAGTVTFLSTDIEGSTTRWEHAPEAMQVALARHDALLRAAIAAQDGVVVRTGGDSFVAAFATAPAALLAALQAQRALQAEPWSPPLDTLRVRMALHTGTTDWQTGDYHTEYTLNRLAQLLAAGHGGQILLSGLTWELVRADLPTDITARALGAPRLKDLGEPLPIFQLVAPDLPAAFPPLRTLDVRPNNLPAQLTPLIGREREIAAATALARQPGVRLVSFTGPGGTGKTRLALQVAAELSTEFADGVFFMNLAPIADPTLVGNTIATTLGLRETGAASLVTMLKDYLRGRQVLLVLDNFEQVLAAAPFVTELLQAAPGLTVLVTSRAAVHVSGEHEFAVPPLALPERQPPPTLPTLSQYEAVRLFIARAQAVKADFQVTNANAPAVAEICYRLDGLPLAIELAAARIRILSPQALLPHLERRLALLTGGARDLPARQQTLRNTIDWSYELLDPTEQTLFRRLAVFVGGATLDAIEAVCNPSADGDIAVLDEVASFVDKSLLQQQDGLADEPRFSMLETIHEYARERLADSGEAAMIQQLHAQFFLSVAEEAKQKLEDYDYLIWLNHLEQEHDNFRAALRWASDSDMREVGLRMVGALDEVWVPRGYWTEGRAWAASFLAKSDEPELLLPRARALCTAGRLAWHQTDYPAAQELLGQALGLFRNQSDKQGLARTLQGLGAIALLTTDDTVTARKYFEEALELYHELNSQRGSGYSLYYLGALAYWEGNMATARSFFEQSLLNSRAMGDLDRTASVLCYLGDVARSQNDYVAARAFYKDGLNLASQIDEKTLMAWIPHNLGRVVQREGDQEQATALFIESLNLFRHQGHIAGCAACLAALAGVSATQGWLERATRLFGAADAQLDSIGHHLEPVDRLESDRDQAVVKARFDAANWERAWMEGHRMSLEEAIALALEAPTAAEQVNTPIPERPYAPTPPRSTARRDPDALTAREVEVSGLVAAGLTDAEIATHLVLSPRTVQVHLRSIYSKLGLTTRSAATRYAIEHHLA
jgi:predicted ATPase/class 3 adenylate cyclase/DNA-binding CsgD family transcriptional regulator